jgi:hypothetical protein
VVEQTCTTGFSSRGLDLARLRDLKHKAMRSGLWFKALRRIDRVLVDVTVRVGKSVHSAALAMALYSVMEKLESAFESRVWNITRKIGFPLARRISVMAQNWGNDHARKWASDESFAKFLAIMQINGTGAHAI